MGETREERKSLPDFLFSPQDGVVMEVLGGIEPEVQSLFSVAHATDIDIGLNQVGLSRGVTQELKIKFIMIWPIR